MNKSTLLFLLAITFISASLALGAGTVRWSGGTSTAWATAGNWTVVTGTPSTPPSSADAVEIGTGTITFQPTITTSVTIASLTFGTTASGTLTLGAAGSLTISGNLSIAPTNNSTDNFINVGAQTLTVQGTANVGSGGGSTAGGTINVSTGTFQINGTLTVNNKGLVAFSGAGTMILQGDFSNAGTFTPGTTSTVNCNGTSAQSIAGGTYITLKSNNAAGISLAAATTLTTLTIGDVTANSIFSDGGFQVTSTGTLNLTSGTFQLGGAAATTFPAFATRNISAGTTIEYASAVAQTVSATPSYKNLKISGAGAKTAGNNLTIDEDLNISAGTLNLSTFTADRSSAGGTLTVASGATLTIGGTNSFPASYTTHTLGSTSVVNYSGTNQSVSGETYGTLNLSGAGTKTAAGPVTINGTLSVATSTTLDPSGNLFTGSGTNTMSLSGTLIVAASPFAAPYTSVETRTVNAGSPVQSSNANPTLDAGLTYQNLTFSGSGPAGTSGDLTVQGTLANTFPAATLNFGSSNVIISGAVANHNVSGFTTTGGLSYTATANTTTLTTSGISVASLTMSGSGGTLNLGTNLSHTVSGNVTLTAGTLNGGTTSTLAVAGNWSGTGTFTAGTGTVNFDGAGVQALPSTATTFNNLTISGGGTKTLGSNTTVASALSVNAGPALSLSTFTLDQRGNLTVNGTLSGTGAITLSTTAGATIDGTGSITDATSLAVTANKTVASTAILSFPGTIALGNSIVMTNNGAVTSTAAGGITGGNSSSGWTQGTNSVLNIAGPLLATGVLTATASGNVVNYNGTSAQTTKGAAYITLKSNNTAGLTLGAASTITTLTIGDVTASSIFSDGGLVITPNASSVLNLTSGTYKLGSATVGTAFPGYGTINIASGTTVEYASAVAQAVSTTPSYKNLTFSGAGTKTPALGTLTVGGNWSLSSSSSLATNNTIVNLTGTLTITSGTLTASNTAAFNVGGDWTNGGTFTPGTGTVTFNGTSPQTISGATATTFSGVAITNTTGAISVSTNFSASGTLNLNGAATLLSPAPAVIVSGTGTLTGTGTAKVTRTAATADFSSQYTITNKTLTNLTVEYAGGAAQNLSALTYGNLKVNNSNGITLSAGDATVNGALTLMSGIIDGVTNNRTITIGSSGTASTGSNSSHVSGKLARVYSGTGSKNFPIGKGGNWRPATLNYTGLTGTSTVTAEQFESALTGTIPPNTALYASRFWTVTQSGGSAFTYDITLDGTGFSPTGTPRILKKDISTIVAFPTSFSSPNYTTTGLTTLSDFALGDECTPPVISVNSPEVCSGSSATLTATVTSNGPATAYLWSPGGATTSTISVSTAGASSVTVTNSNSCTGAGSGTLTVNPNPTVSVGNVEVCASALPATLTATPAGGTGSKTFAWSTGATTSTISTSTAGTYTVTVTDTKGCTGTGTGTLTVNPNPTVSVNSPEVCASALPATLTATPSGGTPNYSFSWSTGATTSTISSSTAGCYSVTVTDSKGCTGSGSGTLTVNLNPTVSVSNPEVCASTLPATLTATPTGCAITFAWSTGATTSTISTSTSGTYSVTVTDCKGCTGSASGTLTVDPNPTVSVNDASVCPGDSATLTATPAGGTGASTFAWSTGATTSTIRTSTAGTYSVTVTDTKGCTGSGSGTLSLKTGCGGHIFPTQTTCSDFTSGTAQRLNALCYQPSSGTVGTATPGVFFYFTKVTAPSASFCVDIIQTKACSSFKFLRIHQGNQIYIYSADCQSLRQGTEPSPGQGRVCITGATPGADYIVSVKYNVKSIQGSTYSGAPPTCQYNFISSIGGSPITPSADSISATPGGWAGGAPGEAGIWG